jgi:hypothetical protein
VRPQVRAEMRRQMRAARLVTHAKEGRLGRAVTRPARRDAMILEDVRLDAVAADRRSRMRRAVDRLMDVLEEFAELGRPPMADLLGSGVFTEWAHYPKDDLFDAATGVLVFYHAHSQDDRPATENGHFHCFVEADRMRPRVRAIRREAADVARPLCHVVGLSIDRHGIPCEIFATNQWVTGERLYPAHDVTRLLASFDAVSEDAPPILRWVSAMVTLFEPQIEALLGARDRRLGLGLPSARARADNRAVDVAAARRIDIGRQLDWLDPG